MNVTPFSQDWISRWFFLLMSGAMAYVLFNIFSPFALTLLAAGIVAILVSPFEAFLRGRIGHERISTIIVLLMIFFIVVGPLATAAVVALNQAIGITQWILENPTWMESLIHGTNTYLSTLPPIIQRLLASTDVSAIIQAIAEWVRAHGTSLFSAGAGWVVKLFIFFICLYFFLIDREKIIAEVIAVSPLKTSIDRSILGRMVETIRGVVFGSLIIACIQGVVAGIGLAIFGVPAPLIWAGLVVIAAQIPMLGTATVMFPAIGYLLLTGNIGAALGLTAWAMLAVGLVDNVIQPFVVGERTRMHALLILLSMLGGLQYFGPMGFILGPTVLATFLVLLEMYKSGFLVKK